MGTTSNSVGHLGQLSELKSILLAPFSRNEGLELPLMPTGHNPPRKLKRMPWPVTWTSANSARGTNKVFFKKINKSSFDNISQVRTQLVQIQKISISKKKLELCDHSFLNKTILQGEHLNLVYNCKDLLRQGIIFISKGLISAFTVMVWRNMISCKQALITFSNRLIFIQTQQHVLEIGNRASGQQNKIPIDQPFNLL